MIASIRAGRPGGAGRLGTRAAAAALALLLAAPVAATVWTRSSLSVRIPKGGRVALENASYATRDWTVALTALEVRTDPRPVNGIVTTVWVFHYTNSDRDPHHVALSVRCLDARRAERTRFNAKATLLSDQPDGAWLEVKAMMAEGDWNQSSWAKVVVDFLSSAEG